MSCPPILETTTGAARSSTDLGKNLLEHLLGCPAVAVGYPPGASYRGVIHRVVAHVARQLYGALRAPELEPIFGDPLRQLLVGDGGPEEDRKSTRLNSSHANISYAVFCLKKIKNGLLYVSR